jgi:tetratricopeptide (TPR) repeat protein
MAMSHSFWFDPALKSFRRVLDLDPDCGMADWGIAIMSMGNPFAWPANPKAMKAAAEAAAEAQRIGARSERERAYIGTLPAFFGDWEGTPHAARARAFAVAVGAVADRYPNDDEAHILYALMLDATALPTDKTFANQHKAAQILEPLFTKYPDHPGVAHYLIHTYDYAELAQEGLPAARAYGAIAPSVPHALHMPSHIYARLGLWSDMIDSNRASSSASRSYQADKPMAVGTYDGLHAMDYMVMGDLQLGRDRDARAVVDEVAAIRTVNVENFPAAYALAAIPSRFALEHADWAQASQLRLSPPDLAWSRFPQAEAILVFSRGLGEARTGKMQAARADSARLSELKDTMQTLGMGYWAQQADIQIGALGAWIALAEHRGGEAVRLMRSAADAEDASDKHPVTPGNVVPMRALLGELFLELKQPRQALAQFERSLERDPNRLRTIYGAAQAAQTTGDRTVAAGYYERVKALAAQGDGARAEFAHAQAFLTTASEAPAAIRQP